jgi:hypothetical protein
MINHQLTFASSKQPLTLDNLSSPKKNSYNFCVVNFGKAFSKLKNKLVPKEKRWTKSSSIVKILSSEKPRPVNTALDKITEIANSEQVTAEKRFKYQIALASIFKFFGKPTPSGSIGFILERGGILIESFYNYPHKKLGRIIAKRLEFKNGDFGLGLSDLKMPNKNKNIKHLHILEDCIASGDSLVGLLIALSKRGYSFDQITIDAAVMSQSGIKYIQKAANDLSIPLIRFRTGGICYYLDEHYYLRRTKEEGYNNQEYYVGDMGDWGAKLPDAFNAKAPWNNQRLDYKDGEE